AVPAAQNLPNFTGRTEEERIDPAGPDREFPKSEKAHNNEKPSQQPAERGHSHFALLTPRVGATLDPREQSVERHHGNEHREQSSHYGIGIVLRLRDRNQRANACGRTEIFGDDSAEERKADRNFEA